MSKADEMFEELGYKKKVTSWKEDDKVHFIDYDTDDTQIQFFIEGKKLLVTNILNMRELQAIYQFCKERGWLDE